MKQSGLPPLSVMVMILVIYIVLGCVMDSLAMILLTIPIFYPMVMGLDFFGLPQTDKSIWFGILALMVVEIGLVHPPVGMNVYIINRLAKDVPLIETFKGVMPVPRIGLRPHRRCCCSFPSSRCTSSIDSGREPKEESMKTVRMLAALRFPRWPPLSFAALAQDVTLRIHHFLPPGATIQRRSSCRGATRSARNRAAG